MNDGAARLVDQAAGRGRSGERDDADRRMRDAAAPRRRRPSPVTRLTTPGGRPASASVCTKLTAESGASSAGLKTTVLPQIERRENLPGRHGDREVPGGDQAADADRLADRHRELVAQLGRRRLAVEAAALAGHELRHVDGFLDVAAGLGDDLAHLARHVAGIAILALGEQLRGAQQDVGPLRRRHLAPAGIGLGGRRHRAIDVGRRRLGEAADQVAGVRRAAVLEGRARGGRHPLAIDEVGVSLYAHGLQFYVPGRCAAGTPGLEDGWDGRMSARAGTGVAGVACLLAVRPSAAEAQRRPGARTGAHLRPGLRDGRLRRTRPAGGPGRRADHRRMGRRDALPRDAARDRRPPARLRDAAADGTSRLVGPADPSAATAPGAAFRVVLRDHDLVRVDADGTERRLTATPGRRGARPPLAGRQRASPTPATTTCSPTTSPPASSASSPPTAARRS